MYKKYIKRFLDIVFSGMGMLLLSWVYLIVAIIVAVALGRPILYSQERIGKNGKPFRLYKFRSMTNAKDENGQLLDEQERLTKVGALLRSLSIDELPELWSIFKGEMSIVGPRPLPTYYGPYFTEEEFKRHNVRGGLIPPDSLSYKAYTTYEEQFKYEVDYAENVSFLLDLKVIISTFYVIFLRIKTDYGSDFDRPHLSIYRKDMNIEHGTKENEEVIKV